MSARAVAVLLTGPPAQAACPPGVRPAAFARALAEDLVDLVSDLAGLTPVIVAAPSRRADAEAVSWPGTEILPASPGAGALAVLALLGARGYAQALVLAPDVPDLPDLLVAKPFSALAGTSVAAVPAADGTLVGLACRLPVPSWLAETAVELETPEAVRRLRAAAPGGGQLAITAGWHRLRTRSDIGLLDPRLEGWEATRALLRAPQAY